MDFTELFAYKKAYQLAMKLFLVSKTFPKEESYALTDQMRRSSRSVCANLAEAYRKRKYPLHFISKLSDCDAENSETFVWITFAFECNYISENQYLSYKNETLEIGKLIQFIIQHPEKFGSKLI